MLYLALVNVPLALTGSGPGDAERTRTLAERERLVDHWSEQGRAPVAVALSGGGYRAAVAHAGLLSILDEPVSEVQNSVMQPLSEGLHLALDFASETTDKYCI